MKYILITFSSRTHLYNFTKFLKQKGASFSVINTPRSIAVSCGLSVKIGYIFYNSIINTIKYSSFGFKSVYLVENFGVTEKFQKLH